jgi:hypothetical protein
MADVYVVERWEASSGRLFARYTPLGIEVEADDDLELESKVSNAIGRAEHLLTDLKIRWRFVSQ